MKYRVIAEDSVRELMESVQKFLDKGWKLQGGVSVSPKGHAEVRQFGEIYYSVTAEGHLFCQAVVADED